jgi:hypothetical protein
MENKSQPLSADYENNNTNDFTNRNIEPLVNKAIYEINQKTHNYDMYTEFEKGLIRKYQFSEFKFKKLILSLMLFYIIINFFCCSTLLIANFQSPEVIEKYYDLPFHLLDFWGSFGFALIESAILVLADMVIIGSYRYFIITFNIGATLIAAILFSFNPEFWEVPCHWIEYSAQIFITLSDVLFIFHQFKKTENILYKYRYYELGFVLFFSLAAVIKLLVYGNVIYLGLDPEKASHFFEFIGEMFNSVFAFVFTMLIYNECQENFKEKFSGFFN